MPTEIVEAKKKDLEELKTRQKYKRGVVRNQDKYRSIRLNEKKKWLRKKKRAEKEIAAINNRIIGEGQSFEDFEESKAKDIEALEKEIVQHDKDLDYITYFPLGEKYISLYAKNEMGNEILDKRDKFRHQANKAKLHQENFKKREMKLANKITDEVAQPLPEVDIRYKNPEEQVPEDTFFIDSDHEIEKDEFNRIVDRSGKILKIEDKERAKKLRKKEENKSFDRNGVEYIHAPKRTKKQEKAAPIKIKARNYRVNRANLSAVKKKTHVKF